MKHGITRVALLVLLAASLAWICCSSDKTVDSEGNVNNTDFVAKESFSFRADVTTHTRLRLDGVSGTVTITKEPESDSVLTTGERRDAKESRIGGQRALGIPVSAESVLLSAWTL